MNETLGFNLDDETIPMNTTKHRRTTLSLTLTTSDAMSEAIIDQRVMNAIKNLGDTVEVTLHRAQSINTSLDNSLF